MNVLKALGIELISKKIVFQTLGVLTLFALATNSLFEIYKVMITPLIQWVFVPHGQSTLLYLYAIPIVSFLLVVAIMYSKYKRLLAPVIVPSCVTQFAPHKGIVLALSKPGNPQATPENICSKVLDTAPDNLPILYKEQSIGQLFKGIYQHVATLEFIWLVTTNDSEPYQKCIKAFLEKFLPNGKCVKINEGTSCKLTTDVASEQIDETKLILSRIYSNENLTAIGLRRSDIIVDITGGTKNISIGLIFGALDSAIDIQYVEQQSGKYDVIPLAISPETVLDKTAEYLLELYSKVNNLRKREVRCQPQERLI